MFLKSSLFILFFFAYFVFASSNDNNDDDDKTLDQRLQRFRELGLTESECFLRILEEDQPEEPFSTSDNKNIRSIDQKQSEPKQLLCKVFEVSNIDNVKDNLGDYLTLTTAKRLKDRLLEAKNRELNQFVTAYLQPYNLDRIFNLVRIALEKNFRGGLDLEKFQLCKLSYGVWKELFEIAPTSQLTGEILQAMPVDYSKRLIQDYKNQKWLYDFVYGEDSERLREYKDKYDALAEFSKSI